MRCIGCCCVVVICNVSRNVLCYIIRHSFVGLWFLFSRLILNMCYSCLCNVYICMLSVTCKKYFYVLYIFVVLYVYCLYYVAFLYLRMLRWLVWIQLPIGFGFIPLYSYRVFRAHADWTFILPSELHAKELRHLPRKMLPRGTTY
jgi:hypothetical protein